MPTEPTPAPARAPKGRPSPDSVVAVLAAIKDLLPSVALSIGLALLVFREVPAANHDPVLAIISGMLGFLTGRGSAPRQAAPPKPAPDA